MNDIFEMRNKLVKLFDDLENDRIEPKKAKEINNAAGKIISTVKVQLAYAAQHGTAANISFVGKAEGK